MTPIEKESSAEPEHSKYLGLLITKSTNLELTHMNQIQKIVLLAAGVFFILTNVLGAGDQTICRPEQNPIVVLTFDDSVKSHYTVARPILKEYGFGATFFITEGFTFKTSKEAYMTWDEIKQLHDDGFEIGNHTRDHLGITDKTYGRLSEQLRGIEEQCAAHGIPKPVTFAWPGNAITKHALPILREHGILFARRGTQPEFAYEAGQGPVYEPGLDHPLLIPTTGDARPVWKLDDVVFAVSKWRPGTFVVLQFHGVPEYEHPWVHTPEENFEVYMRFLKSEDCTVIALRDLAKYVNPCCVPCDPWQGIKTRQQQMAAAESGTSAEQR